MVKVEVKQNETETETENMEETEIQVIKPTIKELSQKRLEQANMVYASKLAHKKSKFKTITDFESSINHLKSKNINYDIDTELSTSESLVLTNGTKVKIAYRGTDVKNLEDIKSDIFIAKSKDRDLAQFKRGEEQLKKVLEKYKKVDQLLGFSLGGNRAISLGNKYKIKVRVFNPALAGHVLEDLKSDFAKKNIKITRTTDDLPSIAYAFKKGVEIIDPISNSINPAKTHNLKNFLTNEPRSESKIGFKLERFKNNSFKLFIKFFNLK